MYLTAEYDILVNIQDAWFDAVECADEWQVTAFWNDESSVVLCTRKEKERADALVESLAKMAQTLRSQMTSVPEKNYAPAACAEAQ
jgi:hypothetical protein